MSSVKNNNKLVAELEKMAAQLEDLINRDYLNDDVIEKHQLRLDEIAEEVKNGNFTGESTYIAYELQGLLHWARGDSETAAIFFNDAAGVKGDNVMYTKLANDILSNNLAAQNTQENNADTTSTGQKLLKVALPIISVIVVFGLINLVVVGGQKVLHSGEQSKLDDLTSEISSEKSRLSSLSSTIDGQESYLSETKSAMDNYNANGQIEAFNSLVDPYNAALENYQANLDDYNSSIDPLNTKVDEANKLADSIGSTYYVVPVPTRQR